MYGVLVQVVDVGPGVGLLLDAGHCCPDAFFILFFQEVWEGHNQSNIEGRSVILHPEGLQSLPGPAVEHGDQRQGENDKDHTWSWSPAGEERTSGGRSAEPCTEGAGWGDTSLTTVKWLWPIKASLFRLPFNKKTFDWDQYVRPPYRTVSSVSVGVGWLGPRVWLRGPWGCDCSHLPSSSCAHHYWHLSVSTTSGVSQTSLQGKCET